MSVVRWFRALAAVPIVMVLAACNGPSGPGTFTAVATGTGIGAVVLEVEGGGIQGFTPLGSTQVYSAQRPSPPNTHRVILIDANGGEMRFSIDVNDIGMDDPFIRVLSAAGTDNIGKLVSSVTTRIERP